MNKDNAISKINSIGKAGSIISKIAIVIMSIGAVTAILSGIFFVSVPKEDFMMEFDGNASLTLNTGSQLLSSLLGVGSGEMSSEFAKGTMTVNGTEYSFVDADYDENSKTTTYSLKSDSIKITARRFAVVMWIAAAYAVINLILFIFVKKLCDALKQCSSPFEESIITGIQNCAWVLIPWAVFGGFFEGVMTTAFSSNIQTGFDLNIPVVLVILLLFGLAFVFKYGSVLQTESDETL